MSMGKIAHIVITGTWILFFNSCGKDAASSNQNNTNSYANAIVYIEPGAVEKGKLAYGTNPLIISPNTQVTWINDDNIPHTATSFGGLFDSGTIAPGQRFSFTFQGLGIFLYSSTLPGESRMSGTIQVGTTPDSSAPTGSPPSPSPSPTLSSLPKSAEPTSNDFPSKPKAPNASDTDTPSAQPSPPTPWSNGFTPPITFGSSGYSAGYSVGTASPNPYPSTPPLPPCSNGCTPPW